MKEWPPPEKRAKIERQVVALAAEILTGKRPLTASAQQMGKLLYWLGLDPAHDEDARDFRLINSEIDHLPLGPDRCEWAADALAQKDREIERAETWAREFGLDACRRLATRFGSPSESLQSVGDMK